MSHPCFTPGPWARNISPKYPVYSEAGHKKVAVALTGVGVSEAEASANLCLIAAAPDLYDATLVLRQHLSLFCSDGDAIAKEVFRVADAAVAKARGEMS